MSGAARISPVTPGVVVYRFSDRLFFANVHFLSGGCGPPSTQHPTEPALRARHGGGARHGLQRGRRLRELHDGLLARNVSLEIARATDPLEATMDRLGLVELIGADHFHGTVTSAVEAVARHDS